MSVIAFPMIGVLTAEHRRALEASDAAFVAAIQSAKDAGVPQGLIVALLHGHAHQQTSAMMSQE